MSNGVVIMNLFLFISKLKKICTDCISMYAAHAAFFLLLSVFPFAMLLLSVMGRFNLSAETITDAAVHILPLQINEFFVDILHDMQAKPGVVITSVSALVTLWSASKGILSIIKGLNRVHGIEETRGFIRLRITAALYTVLFIAMIAGALCVLMLGGALYKAVVGFALFTCFFLFVYTELPNKKINVLSQLPGALFCSVGWLGFSWAFSFYINNIVNYSYMYGSLTSVVLLMLWLYFCMYILFVGGSFSEIVQSAECRAHKL